MKDPASTTHHQPSELTSMKVFEQSSFATCHCTGSLDRLVPVWHYSDVIPQLNNGESFAALSLGPNSRSLKSSRSFTPSVNEQNLAPRRMAPAPSISDAPPVFAERHNHLCLPREGHADGLHDRVGEVLTDRLPTQRLFGSEVTMRGWRHGGDHMEGCLLQF